MLLYRPVGLSADRVTNQPSDPEPAMNRTFLYPGNLIFPPQEGTRRAAPRNTTDRFTLADFQRAASVIRHWWEPAVGNMKVTFSFL